MTDTCNKGPAELSAGTFAAAQEGKKTQQIQGDKPAATKAPWTSPAGDNAPSLTSGTKGPSICP